MKHNYRISASLFLLFGILLSNFVSAQTSISDDSFRENGMNNLKERVLTAVQAFVDEIDLLIDAATEHKKITLKFAQKNTVRECVSEDCAADSAKKYHALRKRQDEMWK